MDLLMQIVAQRKLALEQDKKHVCEEELFKKIAAYEEQYGKPISIVDKIRQSAPLLAVAAEFKRASPSKGDIAVDAIAAEQAMIYAHGGASVISVLTEPERFKGTLQDMLDVALAIKAMKKDRPAVLRKDFIFDRYQILEARAYGADSLLLIVAMLTPEELSTLLKASRDLGIEPLVEVNNEEELDIALAAGSKCIGVNNRNLRTFKLDLNTTVRIADAIRSRGIKLGGQDGIVLLALSGVFSRADSIKYEECGAQGVLVGEMLMRTPNPRQTIQELRGIDTKSRKTLVKICGIQDVDSALVAAQSGANLIGMIFVPNSSRTINTTVAKSIVESIRKFGERSDRHVFAPDHTKDESTPAWFQRNAKQLSQACSRTPLVVGVFQNQSAQEINAIAQEVGLDLVQLHGDEGYEICESLVVPAIRVVHLPGFTSGDSVNIEAILSHVKPGYAIALLLDTAVKGQMGGTGTVFDWSVAERFEFAGVPCLMAGGLTPSNVTQAVHTANPLGVDVSSGVETNKAKDHKKIRDFVRNAKQQMLEKIDDSA
ncbi:N-(5'-phosphoribosyl)anthranilate isomerase indole-3-glycerol-phosphate synthase [Thraustotheca clavata]|uniref:N-(5'-phosphoribosyl)anthranilate isomerase indole-3-glycerol-phosphate synthase n=1 Tax=Thraustotheca clavata TaxID=74557 RepID=A0A1W0A6C8_9STRA|nr:N-(5'-phosphoribosyl)anthranilate isomerase indole-3-glycerol-phosphate synthase [Thraustotheca clavata]